MTTMQRPPRGVTIKAIKPYLTREAEKNQRRRERYGATNVGLNLDNMPKQRTQPERQRNQRYAAAWIEN